MERFTENLNTYLPQVILQRWQDNQTNLVIPQCDALPAVTLFADISGFTTLTEKLTAKGLVGIENLSEHLNTYFGQLITEITNYGGDIVKFAGDALLAIWSGQEDYLNTATMQAVNCSLSILAQLSNYVVDDIHLNLHIGIGLGDLWLINMGGIGGHYKYFVAGEPIRQMTEAEKLAQAGEVCISAQGWQLVQDYVQGYPLSPSVVKLEKLLDQSSFFTNFSLDNSANNIEYFPLINDLQGYISPAIISRLVAGQSEWLSELRRITVLFINLPETDLSDRPTLVKLQLQIETLQNILVQYEGSLENLMVDDKGVVAIAAFGLPPISHENNTWRGMQTAIDFAQVLQQEAVSVKIGITTGWAYCGTVGNHLRREYTIIGDVVNLAARFMQLANGEILCDQTTYQATQKYFQFVTLPPIQVKGKQQLMTVYRVDLANLHPKNYSHRGVNYSPDQYYNKHNHIEHHIIGRKKEREKLSIALEKLRKNHQGKVIIITGEAGIGKSKLVTDVLLQTHPQEAFYSAADAIEQNTPYYVWRFIFSQLLGLNLTHLDNRIETRQKILGLLANQSEITPLIPLLNDLLPLDFPATTMTNSLTGKERADHTRLLLISLLEKCVSQSPKVIILEDAHWFDTLSWLLTWQIVQAIPSLMLILSLRPFNNESLPPGYSELINYPQTEYLQLDLLNTTDTLTLVCQSLGVTSLPSSAGNLIMEKAQGNPFFSEELAYALRDAQLLIIEADHCYLAPHAPALQDLDLPDTVQGVITSRIDRLTPAQQITLKVASVIGRIFAFVLLRDIHPVAQDRDNLTVYLQELDTLDLTPLHTPHPHLSYIFKHIITQDVTYNLMLFSQRKHLHQLIAEWYEETHERDIAEYYEIIAYHYERGEIWLKALEYRLKAGQKSQQIYANQEALNHYQICLKITKEILTIEPNILCKIYMGMGEIYFILSEFIPSVHAYQELLQITRQTGDRPMEAEALYYISYSFFWHHQFHEAMTYADQAYNLALTIDLKSIVARSQSLIGELYSVTACLDDSANHLLDSLQLSQVIGDKNCEGINLCSISLIHNWQGDYQAGILAGEKGRAVAQAHNLQIVHLIALWQLGLLHAGQGDYNQAIADFTTGLNFSNRIGDKIWKCRIINSLGWVYGELYNLERAIELNLEALESAYQIGEPEIIRNAAINLGDYYLLQGDISQAQKYLEQVYSDSQQTGKWGEEWMKWRYLQHCCHSLGGLMLLLGNPQRSLELAEECLQLAISTKSRKNLIKGWRLKGQALFMQGQIKEAENFYQQALHQAQTLANPPQLWQTYHTLGTFYMNTADRSKAMEYYAQAMQIIEQTAAILQDEQLKEKFLSSNFVQAIYEKISD